MPHRNSRIPHLFAVIAVSLFLAGCSDGPAGPETQEVNPGLVGEATAAGLGNIGTTSGNPLPQGATTVTGPGGVTMDATGEAFIQQVSFPDGKVLQTNGITLVAAAPVGSSNTPVDRFAVTAALTGSLEPVTAGNYTLHEPDWTAVNFIDPVPAYVAYVRVDGAMTAHFAHAGNFNIQSVTFFPDKYTCEFNSNAALTVELCEYQIGVMSGTFWFDVILPDGRQIVQSESSFSVPVRRKTIIARKN